MSDIMETIGSSLLQHGPRSHGAYLLKLHPKEAPEIVDHLERLAIFRGYSKIFVKVPVPESGRFVAAGYHLEATMPYFFPGGDAACFLAKYYCAERRAERRPPLVREVLIATEAQQRAGAVPLPAGFAVRVPRGKDAVQMAGLYRKVDASCPFPILDPDLLQTAMNGGSHHFSVWKGKRLVALSCAVIDNPTSSAELTHFAILPEFRCHGLTLHLMQQMEEKLLTLDLQGYSWVQRASTGNKNHPPRSGGNCDSIIFICIRRACCSYTLCSTGHPVRF